MKRHLRVHSSGDGLTRDVEEDLRDHLQYLEGEVVAVRRELEELTPRGASSE